MSKKILAVLLVSSSAIAANEGTIPVDLCRTSSEREQIDMAAGTELIHGQSGSKSFYKVLLQDDATIHSYGDCVRVETLSNNPGAAAGDELYPAPDKNPGLQIKGLVVDLKPKSPGAKEVLNGQKQSKAAPMASPY